VTRARSVGRDDLGRAVAVCAGRTLRVHLRDALLAGCAVLLTACLAGCGSQTQGSGGGSDDPSRRGHDSGTHVHGDAGMHRVPAYAVNGHLRTGSFQSLGEASNEASRVSGDAWVGENGRGTTMTAELTGLEPDTQYVGHLHEQPCAENDGGAHFAFNPEGPAAPPNEVHFAFTADHDGSGGATVHNPRRVGPGARSVVVHDASSEDRLACADLEPATQAQIRQATGAAGASEERPDALTVDVRIEGGTVTPAGDRVDATVGQPIRLNVRSDQAEEIHVHSTPEHEFLVRPGNDRVFEFRINRPGVYEVESHETDTVIVSVAVTP
jgi:hypothetical protein